MNKEEKLMLIDAIDTQYLKLKQTETNEEVLSYTRENLKRHGRRVMDEASKHDMFATKNVLSTEEVMFFYDKIVDEAFGDDFPDDFLRGLKAISIACTILEHFIDGFFEDM